MYQLKILEAKSGEPPHESGGVFEVQDQTVYCVQSLDGQPFQKSAVIKVRPGDPSRADLCFGN
jgi:hypothetical protein